MCGVPLFNSLQGSSPLRGANECQGKRGKRGESWNACTFEIAIDLTTISRSQSHQGGFHTLVLMCLSYSFYTAIPKSLRLISRKASGLAIYLIQLRSHSCAHTDDDWVNSLEKLVDKSLWRYNIIYICVHYFDRTVGQPPIVSLVYTCSQTPIAVVRLWIKVLLYVIFPGRHFPPS